MASTSALTGKKLGFIGGGNMAEALLRGLLGAGAITAADVMVSDPLDARRSHLEHHYGVAVAADNGPVAACSDVLVLCVKPQRMASAITSLRTRRRSALIVSIAAGIPCSNIETPLGGNTRVVRAMPNTPALSLCGASAVAKGNHATDEDLSVAIALFQAVGRCVVVTEPALDAVTGLSGSGPAYVMLFIEALADGGVRAGLPRDIAQLLATQTVLGAAKLQLDTGEHPAVLKDRVTSPGGTTAAGLERLEAHAFRGAVAAAVVAASERASELGKASSS